MTHEIPAPGSQTIMTGKGFIASVNRVAEYLRQRRRQVNALGDVIAASSSDPEAELAELTLEDLEAVLRRALPTRYPERDDLARELFIADNSRQPRAKAIADFERLGGQTYAHTLADAAIEQFRKANS